MEQVLMKKKVDNCEDFQKIKKKKGYEGVMIRWRMCEKWTKNIEKF